MSSIQPETAGGFRPVLKVVIVGQVGHGKSTPIARLLSDSGSLPDTVERGQAAATATTRIRPGTAPRDYVIGDAAGHRGFQDDMVAGAASADAAVLVIDVAEGGRETWRRHGYLLHLLGVRQIAVAITKMDLVDFDETRYAEIAREATRYFDENGRSRLSSAPIMPRAWRSYPSAGPWSAPSPGSIAAAVWPRIIEPLSPSRVSPASGQCYEDSRGNVIRRRLCGRSEAQG